MPFLLLLEEVTLCRASKDEGGSSASKFDFEHAINLVNKIKVRYVLSYNFNNKGRTLILTYSSITSCRNV